MLCVRVSADDNDVTPITAGKVLTGVLLIGGSGASNVKLYDALTVTGTDILQLNALTSDQKMVTIPKDSQRPLQTGLSADITGTGAVAYIWYK